MPAILKLYEQILLINLRRELQRTTPLHENQRGFIEGKCTMHNIKDIVDQVNQCKISIKKDIDKKLTADKRCTHYLLFIDISKAFDSINRNKLLKMMADRGFNGLLIKAFEKLFADTRMVINDEKVYTNKGVMQGGVTSPTTFAIYIDNLLRELNKTSKAFALADDIVCYCEG